jgi:alpha-galactosidase
MIEADFCGRAGDGETDQELYAHASAAIAAASAATNRTIAFYMCNWGSDAPWKWAPQYANLFRNTVDIQYVAGQCNFPFILRNFDATVVNSGTPPSRPGLPGTGIGAWNDPDMLCTGFRGITDTEGRSQFSLWCVLSAPLLLGTDVRSASAFTMATIGNVEAIAIDQDPLGVQGMEFTLSASQPPANVSFYYKPLLPQAGAQSVALAVLNRGNVALPGVNISFEDLGFAFSQRVVVRDIWAQTTSALLQGSFVTRPIDSHETLLLKLTPV